MKILFVNRLFQDISGGIERMSIAMMSELCRRGIEIELLSWDKAGAEAYYPLEKDIIWHHLNMGNAEKKAGWVLRLKRQIAIRRIIKRIKPDVIIAFQHGPFLAIALAAIGLRIPIIAAERNAPQRYDHLRVGKRRSLIFQTFRLADRITVQLDDYINGYPEYLRNRITSIPNPVYKASVLANPEGEFDENLQLLTVGRLSYQKNQEVLIEAYSRLIKDFPQWRLVIVGDGEDKLKLIKLVTIKGISERVEFAGAVKDVEVYYQKSHLFCLTSRWEGFPNALAEAMAHGLPVVGFEECAGIGQLISDGKTGCLAKGNGSVESLIESLLPLMKSNDLRKQMGARAVKAMEKYNPVDIFDQWEALFREISTTV